VIGLLLAALAAGDVAPDVELSAHDGSRVRASALQAAGQTVLLAFFPAAFTPG
jgi:peroxiredoxin